MGAYKAALRRLGHWRKNPRHRSTRQEKGRWGQSLPCKALSAGRADDMAGRAGCQRRKWGLSHPPRVLFFRSACVQYMTINLSLTHLTYLLWDLWSHQPYLTRDAKKRGHSFWTEDPGLAPGASTPLAPPDGFITSYAAHLKPIESLGGRECLTQISTSEGVSATLGNH